MWPWEHLAFGYVLASVYAHLFWRRPPTFVEFVAIVLATQLPDIVDKPLSWTFAVVPNGTSVAHSVLVTAPLLVTIWMVSLVFRRGSVPMMFGLAYASHLVGDVFYDTLVYGGSPNYEAVLWPVVRETQGDTIGFVATSLAYFEEYIAFVSSPDGTGYVVLQLALFAVVVTLWLYDGAPGAKQLVRVVSSYGGDHARNR